MRFCIIYQNRDDIRQIIESQFIPQVIKQGINLEVQEINHPLVRTCLHWSNEINSLPFNMQCEEVEWKENKLISIRKLTIDAIIIQ